jgi:uncharacterized protein with NRDE domain
MCLISVGFALPGEFSFVLAANRDERHARPSTPARWWPDAPHILGGRDEIAGGSWLAVDRRGRIAAVTNFFEPPRSGAPRSRGGLVAGFLEREAGADTFGTEIADAGDEYGPFNLLLFDGRLLHYTSNRTAPRALDPGIHTLSNGAPGSGWHKVLRAEQGLAEALAGDAAPEEALFDLLAERDAAALPPESHRRSLFILDPVFGTRCSTVVLLRRTGTALFVERRFDSSGQRSGESRVEFELAA